MIEFGLSFVIFIALTLGVVDLMIMGYDFNLAQRVAWEAARRAAIGQTNRQILDYYVDTALVGGWIQPLLLVAKPETSAAGMLTPNDIAQRVRGRRVETNLGFRFGVSFFLLGEMTYGIPVKSRLVVVVDNDRDRDGQHDAYENGAGENRAGDHDNDGDTDEVDFDDDNDGVADATDLITLNVDAAGAMQIVRPGGLPTLSPGSRLFHAPVRWTTSSGVFHWEPEFPVFPREAPSGAAYAVPLSIVIGSYYDSDNDAVEDAYDASPAVPTVRVPMYE